MSNLNGFGRVFVFVLRDPSKLPFYICIYELEVILRFFVSVTPSRYEI